MAQEVEDSDSSDGEWSQPTNSDASRSSSSILKSSLPPSHYSSRKRKAFVLQDEDEKKESRKGIKRSILISVMASEIPLTILQLSENTPATRGCFLDEITHPVNS